MSRRVQPLTSAQLILDGASARAALLQGMDAMADVLRPTLGPIARTVAVARILGNEPPEVLDSAATIARRTIQLADPFADMGGMIVRHLVWRVFERTGDGSATAAVLVQALMREAMRYVAAGYRPTSINRGIERGCAIALVELRAQARPIELPEEIAGVVAGILRSPRLAEMIGEVVDSVGPDGSIVVDDTEGTETVREYVEGVRWSEGFVSPYLLREGETTARLVNPRVFVTDHPLDRAEHLLPALEACVEAGDRSLMVVAPEVRDSAVGLLVVNRQRGVLDGVVAVRAPSFGVQRSRILEDIAVVTGGRCLSRDGQDRLSEVTVHDLGKARQAWATRFDFGILGGQGSKTAIRQRIAEARSELSTIEDDEYTQQKIRERIGKLAGTAAIIRVGAPTKTEQEELKARVQAAVKSARLALQQGVVPGGGAAMLACIPALETLAMGSDEEAMGIRALTRALAEPMRVIAWNAGLPASAIVHEARRRAPPWTFDVVRREWVDAWRVGLVDPLAVARTALETGVSAAKMALTADVLIRRKQAPLALNP